MTETRTVLPNRRPSLTIEFMHGSIQYRGSASFYSTSQVMEVFLSAGKPGSEVEAVARDCAVILSLALQYGTPLDVLGRAVTRTDGGEAAGPMGMLIDILQEELSR